MASVGLPRETVARQPNGELWLIRHAESVINVAPRPDQPDDGVSYPLTRTGIQQAKALAKALEPLGLSSLFSSTRLRAIQTADAISRMRIGNLIHLPYGSLFSLFAQRAFW